MVLFIHFAMTVATALPLRVLKDLDQLTWRVMTAVGQVTKCCHSLLSQISAMRHLLMRLQDTSRASLSCLLLNNCSLRFSIKLTVRRSIRREDPLSGASCQHLSSSSTHAPASLPSST